MMTTHDVREIIKDLCAAAGGQHAWAKAMGISQAYVNQVIQGNREPGPAILDAVGLERVVSYRLLSRRRG